MMSTYYKKNSVLLIAFGMFFLGAGTLFIIEEIKIGDNYYDDLIIMGLTLISTLFIALKTRVKINEKKQ